MNSLRVSGSAALAIVLVATPPALAFDPSGNTVADAFLSAIEPQDGGSLTYDGVEESGSTVTINGINVVFTGEDGGGSAELGSTAIENGTVGADDALSADRIQIDDITMKQDDDPATMTAKSLLLTEPEIPTEADADASDDPSSRITNYERAELTEIVFTDEGGSTLPIGKIVAQVTERTDDGEPRGGTLTIENAVVDTETLDDEDTKKQITDLGYDKVVIGATATADWVEADGTTTLDELTITAEDMGKVSISGRFLGFTPDVLAQLQRDDNDFNQLMQAMQGVSVSNLAIRYDDSSLAERAMTLAAKEQDVTKAEFIDTLNMQASQMLAMLENKPFEETVSAALKAFLAAPGSLEITANPQQPVPFAQLVGTVMMAPQTLPTVLAVDVTANEPQTGATAGQPTPDGATDQ